MKNVFKQTVFVVILFLGAQSSAQQVVVAPQTSTPSVGYYYTYYTAGVIPSAAQQVRSRNDSPTGVRGQGHGHREAGKQSRRLGKK